MHFSITRNIFRRSVAAGTHRNRILYVTDHVLTEGVQASSFRVLRPGARLLGQVGGHEVHGVLLVAAVDHAQTRRRRELGPVRCSRQPLEVVSATAR